MTRAKIAGVAFATLLVLLALAAGYRALKEDSEPAAGTSPETTPSPTPAAEATPVAETHPELIYGRITTIDGATYEGRLRWGEAGNQEAFWGDYFNGSKHKSFWAAYVPPGRLPRERRPVEVLGITISHKESEIEVGRQFMARFGE